MGFTTYNNGSTEVQPSAHICVCVECVCKTIYRNSAFVRCIFYERIWKIVKDILHAKKAKEDTVPGLETDFFPNLPNGQVIVIFGCPYKSCNCPNILRNALSLDTTTTVIARLGAIEYGMMLSMNAVPRMLALQPSPWALS